MFRKAKEINSFFSFSAGSFFGDEEEDDLFGSASKSKGKKPEVKSSLLPEDDDDMFGSPKPTAEKTAAKETEKKAEEKKTKPKGLY